jgi:branched-chain amino acid aminotransferase
MHVPFPDNPDRMKSSLLRLAEANNAWNATLRVAVVRNRGGLFEGPDLERDYDIVAFTRDLNQWGESARLALKPHGRHAQCEFAGAKILSWAHNLTWYEEAHDRGYDEVALLNERGEVSECTSANIFALRGSEVSTPPLTSGCLPGVTRALLLEEISIPGLSIVEKTLLPTDLEQADQIFITSTTRSFLPIAEIEGLKLKPGTGVPASLHKAFEEYRQGYVKANPARVPA